MKQHIIAELAGVSQSDVSNFQNGRTKYVTYEKQCKIQDILDAPKKDILLYYLEQGREIDLFFSLDFGLSALSQRIGDLKREGYNIVNLNEGANKPGIYKMVMK